MTMDVASPPTYRRYSRPGPAPAAELPPYSRRNTLAQPVARREPTEHLFQLVNSQSRAWAILNISSSAKSSKSLPTFFEKENINGSLELHVDKGDSIHAVSALVTGRIITGSSSNDTFTFLSQSVPIWSKDPDVPRLPSASPGTAGAKLIGQCVWPFSIPLPKTVTLPGPSGEPQAYRLPETFLERDTQASVQYDFTILISKGLLRSDSQIKTAFGYVPSIRPDACSLLRQIAYQQHLPVPGPDNDPEGWKALRSVIARGSLFKSRRAEVKCKLSLAKPLSYTRGSVLPLHLMISGDDAQALDMLSAPSSIQVSLRRRVRYYNKPMSLRTDVAWNETYEDVGTAKWWTSSSQSSSSRTRHLEGEIRLPKDLRPTSEVGHFSVSYSVVLRPFYAAGYTSGDTLPLISEPIEIATMHPRGPRSLPSSPPPAYDPIQRQNEDFHAALRGFPIGVH